MDYLKLLNGLKNEFFEAGKAKYESFNIVVRILLTIIFIPMRIGFFFQCFGLMLSAYIMTLGTVRWQPVISEASFAAE